MTEHHSIPAGTTKAAIEAAEAKPRTLEPDPAGIPSSLKALPRWVCWSWQRLQDKSGRWKWTKPPVNAKTGQLAKSNDPSTWGTFEEALAYYQAHRARVDGVGFMLGDGWAGVDLDDCRNPATGAVDARARKDIDRLRSYGEVSPTGTGVKILLRGTLPTGGSKRGHVELYSEGRYFTVTGAHLDDTPDVVAERQAELDDLHRRIAGDPPPGEAGLDDAEVVRRASEASGKPGARFRRLWAGDLTGYPSHSEADLALCGLLRYWCGRNPDRIDALFRQSGLFRDKWNRQDYRERTLNKALRGKVYSPHSRFPTTDIGNAERLAHKYGADLRYCKPWKTWLHWTGRVWSEDQTEEVLSRAIKTVRSIYLEAEECSDQKRRTALAEHALRSESATCIGAMIDLARGLGGIPVLPRDLDRDPWLFNCLNGTIDLRTGTLREHRREDLLTKLAPVQYDQHATCPLWEKSLNRWMDGNQDLIRYLQRLIGHCLTGDVSEQSLWFFYGKGANGKSTFLWTVLAMLGDYGMQAVSELLMLKHNESHPTERADLFGRRFAATIETEQGKRMAEALMKQITGGDRIRARKCFKDFFEFSPTHKIVLAANHKPVVQGTDHALWRRIKLVPFTVTISDEEKDKKLPEKLKAELPGVLAWAVRGCLDWQREGLAEPDEIRQATSKYQAEQDQLAAFLAEACVAGASYRVQSGALLEAFQNWSGNKTMSPAQFKEAMEEKGFTPQKGHAGRSFYHGIQLPG
jgi:putative DNA primase/helicase